MRMDIRKVFAANVRRYREAAGLSQAALAVKIGVDRAHVSSMERAQQNVTIVTLWHVSRALDVPAYALLQQAPDELSTGVGRS
jgi:transcriptional regulator with XRE-family HTH domain